MEHAIRRADGAHATAKGREPTPALGRGGGSNGRGSAATAPGNRPAGKAVKENGRGLRAAPSAGPSPGGSRTRRLRAEGGGARSANRLGQSSGTQSSGRAPHAQKQARRLHPKLQCTGRRGRGGQPAHRGPAREHMRQRRRPVGAGFTKHSAHAGPARHRPGRRRLRGQRSLSTAGPGAARLGTLCQRPPRRRARRTSLRLPAVGSDQAAQENHRSGARGDGRQTQDPGGQGDLPPTGRHGGTHLWDSQSGFGLPAIFTARPAKSQR